MEYQDDDATVHYNFQDYVRAPTSSGQRINIPEDRLHRDSLNVSSRYNREDIRALGRSYRMFSREPVVKAIEVNEGREDNDAIVEVKCSSGSRIIDLISDEGFYDDQVISQSEQLSSPSINKDELSSVRRTECKNVTQSTVNVTRTNTNDDDDEEGNKKRSKKSKHKAKSSTAPEAAASAHSQKTRHPASIIKKSAVPSSAPQVAGSTQSQGRKHPASFVQNSAVPLSVPQAAASTQSQGTKRPASSVQNPACPSSVPQASASTQLQGTRRPASSVHKLTAPLLTVPSSVPQAAASTKSQQTRQPTLFVPNPVTPLSVSKALTSTQSQGTRHLASFIKKAAALSPAASSSVPQASASTQPQGTRHLALCIQKPAEPSSAPQAAALTLSQGTKHPALSVHKPSALSLAAPLSVPLAANSAQSQGRRRPTSFAQKLAAPSLAPQAVILTQSEGPRLPASFIQMPAAQSSAAPLSVSQATDSAQPKEIRRPTLCIQKPAGPSSAAPSSVPQAATSSRSQATVSQESIQRSSCLQTLKPRTTVTLPQVPQTSRSDDMSQGTASNRNLKTHKRQDQNNNFHNIVDSTILLQYINRNGSKNVEQLKPDSSRNLYAPNQHEYFKSNPYLATAALQILNETVKASSKSSNIDSHDLHSTAPRAANNQQTASVSPNRFQVPFKTYDQKEKPSTSRSGADTTMLMNLNNQYAAEIAKFIIYGTGQTGSHSCGPANVRSPPPTSLSQSLAHHSSKKSVPKTVKPKKAKTGPLNREKPVQPKTGRNLIPSERNVRKTIRKENTSASYSTQSQNQISNDNNIIIVDDDDKNNKTNTNPVLVPQLLKMLNSLGVSVTEVKQKEGDSSVTPSSSATTPTKHLKRPIEQKKYVSHRTISKKRKLCDQDIHSQEVEISTLNRKYSDL